MQNVIGRPIADYAEREAMKSRGHALISTATTMAEKVAGANMVLEGHWHRDLGRGDTTDPVLTLKRFALGKEDLEREYGAEVGSAIREYWEGQP